MATIKTCYCYWLGGLLGFALVTEPALSQPISMEPLVITATRMAQTEDQTLEPILVITRSQIQRSGAVDVSDVLQRYSGLEVARTGGYGQQTSVFLRGTNSNHVLVMIDGVKVNSPSDGGAPWQNIDVNQIQRIEVVKGPRSALYGSDAIGGVINIITRRAGKKGLSGGASVGVGRYNTRKASADAYFKSDKISGGLGVSGLRSDGFPTFTASSVPRGYSNRTLNAYLASRGGPVQLNLQAWDSRGNTQYSNIDYDPKTFAFAGFASVSQDYLDQTLKGSLGRQLTPDWHAALVFSQARQDIFQNWANPSSGGRRDFTRTRRRTVEWQNQVFAGTHSALSLGAAVERDHAETLSYGAAYDRGVTVVSQYAEDDFHMGRHGLVVALRHTYHPAFGSHYTWNADYGFQLTSATRLTAGVGTGFAAPTLNDLYGYGGNPDLQAETSRNVEFGVRHRIGKHQEITLNVFDNRVDNLIQSVFNGSTFTFQNQNVQSARIQGVEASYTLRRADWTVHLGGIYQDPYNETDHTRLLRRARYNLTGGVAYRLRGLELGAQARCEGDRRDVDAITGAPTTTGAYTVVNFTADYRFAHQWDLRAALNNAFDRNYELVSGYRTAGRSLTLSLAYRFGDH